MPSSSLLSPEEFEAARLGLFSRNGFEARPFRCVDRQGREIYALRRGESACPTLLIHGGLADASVWTLVAGHLEGAVVIPDRPGCGLSYGVNYGGLDFEAEAASWLLAVVDALNAEQVNLVGNSMGGYFSMAFSCAHPERVRNLVLVGAPAGLDKQLPLFIRLLGVPGMGSMLSRMEITDPERLRNRVFEDLVSHAERVPVDLLEIGIANSVFPASQLCVHTMLRAVRTFFGGWRDELMMREPMATLPVRTLFAWGDADSFAPASTGRELAARMADASFTLMKDTGHMPQLDEPEQVARIVTDFVSAPAART